MLCKRCVLPEHKPDIRLNEEGICNLCADFDRQKTNGKGRRLLESDLIKVLNRYKSKGPYDCLVMCSGGKDSVMSLYYMKKRYRKTPLVFTFDHGFENDEALENIKNAVKALDVDWLYYKTDFMRDIFARIITNNEKVSLCHICAIWYMQLTYDVAARYDIPIIVAGWTKGQSDEGGDSSRAYGALSQHTADFVTRYMRTIPKYRNFPRSMAEATRQARRRWKGVALSPHWYLPWDERAVIDLLRKELHWKAPQRSYPKGSTNCLLNFISVDRTMKECGYTHYHVEMSKLIRKGQLSREEALDRLRVDFDESLMNDIRERATR
jgi:hypothetical protein